MRIRKNAKLSPLLYTCSSSLLKNGSLSVETFQTHVCQLNQSPWDVIPFHSNNSTQVLLLSSFILLFSDLLGFFFSLGFFFIFKTLVKFFSFFHFLLLFLLQIRFMDIYFLSHFSMFSQYFRFIFCSSLSSKMKIPSKLGISIKLLMEGKPKSQFVKLFILLAKLIRVFFYFIFSSISLNIFENKKHVICAMLE